MYINEISAIVGSRPVYNDKLAQGRRARKWGNVKPHQFQKVVAMLLEKEAQMDSVNGIRVGFEISLNWSYMVVKMKEVKTQFNNDRDVREARFLKEIV